VLLSIASSFRDTVEQPLPQPSVPFLRYLARSIQGYAEIYSGRTELTGSATILDSPQKVYEFMGALRDETRRHPIVLVSAYWTDEGPYYLAEPAEVSGAIRGLGQVYFEGSTPISLGGTTGLANILRRELGIPGDYLTWGGAIRVYRPGDVLALTPNDHRYMQGRDFIDKGDLLERLRNGVYLLAQHDFTADSANPITAGKDIPFFTQMARLDLLRATTTTETAASTPEIAELQRERDDWRKFAEDFDGENIELRKQLTASRGEVSTLKVTVTGLEDMLASLRAENAALYEERKERERAAAASALPPLDPETLSDGASVLTAVKERFSERLSFTAKFERSLLKFEPNNPALFADVYEAIQDLSTIMWNEKFGRRSANFMNEFNAQSRFVFSPTESKLTKEKPGMSDYRADVFEGERFEAWSHLKYGNKPGEQFRIHFDFHEDSERIIVSWVGDHMPTSSSSKTGRRRG
jgi:hypothetical protein